MIERRRFFRAVYRTPAQLQQGDQHWSTTLLDLSLQGALLKRPENWDEKLSGRFTLTFTLADSNIQITMEVEPTHLDMQRLGVYCHNIDIDSASHLRRLIELNAGDTELLLRELAHLIEDHVEHEQQPPQV
ncbi:PilZ domain-containing protein [Tolumonas lignilytica]|jgi:PilZ domain.|uniref:PilZ domain-containing protein n=1 Tax=Tolumonas lignilytica TaxID=1283284 RepID=UPI000463D06E|nr:PilZ domain-containing protein [Tolumonas lignilytica]